MDNSTYMPSVIQTLTTKLGECNHAGSGSEYVFKCPVCNKQKHLYVNPDRNKFICFRCGNFKGNLKYLLKYLGIESNEVSDLTSWQSKINKFKYGQTKVETIEVCRLPDDCVKLIPNTDPWNYLIDRGLSANDIEYYKIYYSPYLRRVVIPSFDEFNTLDYWIARKIYDKTYGPRYLFPKQVKKENKLFDIHRIRKNSDVIIIAEGVLSAIIAGRDCTATYGKGYTKEQLFLLKKYNFKTHIIAYDGDTQKKIRYKDHLAYKDLANDMIKLGMQDIRVINFDYRDDPASVGKQDICFRIMNATKISSLGLIF